MPWPLNLRNAMSTSFSRSKSGEPGGGAGIGWHQMILASLSSSLVHCNEDHRYFVLLFSIPLPRGQGGHVKSL